MRLLLQGLQVFISYVNLLALDARVCGLSSLEIPSLLILCQSISTPTIVAGQCVTIKPEMTVEHALAKIDEFDILAVPGGNPAVLLDMIQRNTEEVKFIKAFNNTSTGRDGDKLILSVCTGALFLGATGVLSGLKATTHHMALDVLSDLDSSIEIVSSVASEGTPDRYVDGGINKQGKRVITAGYVFQGLNAASWYFSHHRSCLAA